MIQTLHVKNFKCFKDQAVDFGSITLLSGLNGMGKSTIMQALVLLRQSYQQSLLPETGLLLNGELISIGLATDALYEGAGKNDKISFTLWADQKNGEETEAKWSFDYDQEADVLSIDDKPENNIYSINLFTDEFHYLQAERIGPRSGFGTSDFQVRQHRQIGSRGEYTAHYLSAFGDNDIPILGLAYSTAMSNSLNNQVEGWLGEISPGTRLHVTTFKDLDQVGIKYSFVMGKVESNYFRGTNVGFGITYTLPILVAILSAKPGSLVLVENPEAHLHPRGQAMMGHLLARAANHGVQIVIETHSDHVLNGIRVAVHDQLIDASKVSLHYFERRLSNSEFQHYVTSPQIDQDGRIDKWPDGFFDQWNKDLLRLVIPR